MSEQETIPPYEPSAQEFFDDLDLKRLEVVITGTSGRPMKVILQEITAEAMIEVRKKSMIDGASVGEKILDMNIYNPLLLCESSVSPKFTPNHVGMLRRLPLSASNKLFDAVSELNGWSGAARKELEDKSPARPGDEVSTPNGEGLPGTTQEESLS